jgi:RNA polymerase sigma-70 factor (ECF subfamily)
MPMPTRPAETIDLAALGSGDKKQWDAFVRRYAGLILTAVRSQARGAAELDDLVQEVFLRLCKNGFRLLKSYDATRAGLSTWLTIVARSTARDVMRRRTPQTTPYDLAPEMALSVTAEPVERIKVPDGLLSGRQRLVLTMLYERDMDVNDAAIAMGVDPQTVRSTHHKAMLKLREHFAIDEQGNRLKPGS